MNELPDAELLAFGDVPVGSGALGFKFEDTKIILASHGHPDDQTGDALVKQMTGAMTEFMAEDVPAIKNIEPRDGKEHSIEGYRLGGAKVFSQNRSLKTKDAASVSFNRSLKKRDIPGGGR